MTYVESVIGRMKEYRRKDVAFLRKDGDWDFEYEDFHPMLERPRLVVTMPPDATYEDVERRFAGWGIRLLARRFWECTE